jgi:phospholipase/carboxylesterase
MADTTRFRSPRGRPHPGAKALRVNGRILRDRADWTEPVVRWKRAAKSGLTTPVVLLLHGRGADEHDLFDLAERLPRHYDYASLRAPVPVEGGGYTWYENRGPARPVPASLRTSLASFRRWLEAPAGLGRRPCFLLGFSAGMMMGAALLLDAPARFQGAVLLSGAIALEATPEIAVPGRLAGVPVFYGFGTNDPFFPTDGSSFRTTAAYLRERSGAILTEKSYPMGHAICNREIDDIAAWFASGA